MHNIVVKNKSAVSKQENSLYAHRSVLKKSLTVLFLIFLSSCDFTPPINRKIIDAQNYITEQKYNKATFLYEDILKSNPGPELRLKICYQLGELYSIYLGEYSKAVYYYNEVKDLTEDPIWLIKTEEKLADINFNYRKNYKDAIKNYTKLSEFTPKLNKYDFFQLQIALAYYYLNDTEKAVAQLTKIQTDSNHEYFVRSFYYLGLVYFEKKDYNKALFVWLEYLKRETKKEYIVQAKFLVANIYESTENLKMAYDIYYSIANDYPNPDVIQNRLTALYERRVSRRR
jgi:tetratricopeptide (TPR) repeat protein